MAITNTNLTKIRGNQDIAQLADKRVWDATEGFQTLKRWRGVEEAIKAKFNEITSRDSGYDSVEEEVDGVSGTLIARITDDSGGEEGNNTEADAVWELYASPLLKPIESHMLFDGIIAERKRQIVRACTEADNVFLKGTPLTGDAENALYWLLSNGVLDFYLTQLSLRKNIIVGWRTKLTASYAYLNRVQTLASIDPPSAMLGVLTSLPKSDGNSGAWEWLKLAPQIRQISKRKFQMSYEWIGAERWSKLLYGGSWEKA